MDKILCHPAVTVLTAYGFSAKKDLLAQLLNLNMEAAAKFKKGEPVTSGLNRWSTYESD